MDQIKLVIWDLDDTFWKGTLSEEGIMPISKNISIVKHLANRGILNSIVSKNDFFDAKEKLTELGVWEYFIFPIIAWQPKGQAVKSVISNCQLTANNVLFIDDNDSNLNEVKFYCPDINIKLPNFLITILNNDAFIGKDDFSHSRLNQYKILEKKKTEQSSINDNLKFLKSSKIQIEFISHLNNHIDRIEELISRTNQLNYTKIRLSREEIISDINDINYKTEIISVKDKYGEYGIVGLYQIHIQTNTLKHFIFSCRILNLGIPQYIYSKLKFPKIQIIDEVAEILDTSSEPNWIIESFNKTVSQKRNKPGKYRIFLKGGCDLSQMNFYLNKGLFDVKEETNYTSENNFDIHNDHSLILLDSLKQTKENKKIIENSDYIPFVDNSYYKTALFDYNYDCLLFSLLSDFTQEIYSHNEKNISIVYGGYYNHITEMNITEYKKKFPNSNPSSQKKFDNHFKFKGQISPLQLVKNLEQIRTLIPTNIPIILINGAELNPNNKLEKTSQKRHVSMNKAVDQFITNSENTILLDLRKIITQNSQITGSIRNYDRQTYKLMSVELLRILNSILNKNLPLTVNLSHKGKLSYHSPKLTDFLIKIKNTLFIRQ